jgi:hypothetical protein
MSTSRNRVVPTSSDQVAAVCCDLILHHALELEERWELASTRKSVRSGRYCLKSGSRLDDREMLMTNIVHWWWWWY